MQDDPGRTDLARAIRFSKHEHGNERSHALTVKKQRDPWMTPLDPSNKFGEVSFPQPAIINVSLRALSRRGQVTVLSADTG